jgi:putative Mg2+ transporter-C (MgtC) family protein
LRWRSSCLRWSGWSEKYARKAQGCTPILIGLSAALFMLVSKYGFMDVLQEERVVVDHSRVAAEIVSGMGFGRGGIIFMRRDVVRGFTTAASVWLAAALGMARGAGLPVLAVATTVGHCIIMLAFPQAVHYLRRGTILSTCVQLQFGISHVRVEREGPWG